VCVLTLARPSIYRISEAGNSLSELTRWAKKACFATQVDLLGEWREN